MSVVRGVRVRHEVSHGCPMRVQSAEFVIGVARLSQLPRTNLPEIAWAGRSNVGKSSLINRVVGVRNLARISNTPGKTRQLNFYRVNNAWHLVDLPGYGFAAGPEAERESWRALIEPYLRGRRQLAGVAVLVDARIGPTGLDAMMFEWLAAHELFWAVILSKADKVSGNALSAVRKSTQARLGPNVLLIPCSARTGRGVAEVQAWMNERLRAYAAHKPALLDWQSQPFLQGGES